MAVAVDLVSPSDLELVAVVVSSELVVVALALASQVDDEAVVAPN